MYETCPNEYHSEQLDPVARVETVRAVVGEATLVARRPCTPPQKPLSEFQTKEWDTADS